LKQGNPHKNKAQVLDSLSFESLSHLIKVAVNWVMQPTNETRASDPPPLPPDPTTKIAHCIHGKTMRKASGKTVKGKGASQPKRRKVVVTSKEPNIQSTKHNPKNLVATMNSLG